MRCVNYAKVSHLYFLTTSLKCSLLEFQFHFGAKIPFVRFIYWDPPIQSSPLLISSHAYIHVIGSDLPTLSTKESNTLLFSHRISNTSGSGINYSPKNNSNQFFLEIEILSMGIRPFLVSGATQIGQLPVGRTILSGRRAHFCSKLIGSKKLC
jgi:hypothetical protein